MSKILQNIGNDPSKYEKEVRHLLKSVNDESNATRHSWVIFMGLMAYFIVAVTSINHTDFLLNTPLNLPFLNIGIPLTAFFTFGPPVLLFVHMGLLVQHVLLADKLNQFDRLLKQGEKQLGPLVESLRQELDSYFFTQHLVGTLRNKMMNVFLGTLTAISLSILPVFLFLYFQVSYLPYHDYEITWFHRLYLFVDIFLILILRARMDDVDSDEGNEKFFSGHSVVVLGRLSILFSALFLSFFIATIPSSRWERTLIDAKQCVVSLDRATCHNVLSPRRQFCSVNPVPPFDLTRILFDGDIDPGTGNSQSFFSRNLIVTDKGALSQTQIKQNKKGGGDRADKSFLRQDRHLERVSLRGRNLCYATFDRTNLRGADLTDADLTRAQLIGTDLRGARLSCAVIPRSKGFVGAYEKYKGCTQLKKVDLSGANLEATDLRGANLWSATLNETNLKNANLSGAILDKADLSFALLENANLVEASLIDATMLETDLQGANMRFAKLQSASLRKTKLQGANLFLARAEGANFSFSNLQGAVLKLAWLHGANFESARLDGADLRNAELQGANFTAAFLDGADLQYAKLQGANFKSASINFADFSKAQVWATGPPVVVPTKNMLANLSALDVRTFSPRDQLTLKQVSRRLLDILKTRKERRLSEYSALRRLTPLLDPAKFKDWNCNEGKICPEFRTWEFLSQLSVKNTVHRDDKLGDRLAALACNDTSQGGHLAKAIIQRISRSSPLGVPACFLKIFKRSQIAGSGAGRQMLVNSQTSSCPKENALFIDTYLTRCAVASRLSLGPGQGIDEQNRYLETLQLAAEKQYWQQRAATQKTVQKKAKPVAKKAIEPKEKMAPYSDKKRVETDE